MATTINRLREKIALARLRLNWRWLQLCAAFHRQSRSAAPSLVLVPCEPWSVVGSRGDEAMVYSILRDFRLRHPEGRITIVTGSPDVDKTPDGKRLVRDFGVEFAHAWRPRLFLSNIVRVYREAQATEVYVLGADCMDGHWSMFLSLTLLAAADLAARMGIATRLTGFSWNEHPRVKVVKAFRNVTPKLPILVRDPVSYERFKSVLLGTGTKCELVADVAFNLQPRTTSTVQAELYWMKVQHARGRFILGFNLHPMLVSKEKLQGFIDAVAVQLRKFMGTHPNVAIVLVPHDYREGSDSYVLKKVLEGLAEETNRVHIVKPVLSAEELKSLTGGLDALFTSRMHLGIAALGMGKPIAAFAYQGKFAGLYKQFSLTASLLLVPADVRDLASRLDMLNEGSLKLRGVVGKRLTQVKIKARENLMNL